MCKLCAGAFYARIDFGHVYTIVHLSGIFLKYSDKTTRMETISIISTYLLRVLPGIILVCAVLIFTRPPAAARVGLYLLVFVLLRDALTPLGLWSFGSHRGVFWIRLADDPWFLVLFGMSAAVLSGVLYLADAENRKGIVWIRGTAVPAVSAGMAGLLAVVLPFAILYRALVPIAMRGGPVAIRMLPAILVFAMLGNLLEELLFRGYVLEGLKRRHTERTGRRFGWVNPGVQSGLVFALCHVFLATTVSSVGVPLLLFTLWEGIIAGLVGERYGVLAATVTHGGAIFLLSSGLL